MPTSFLSCGQVAVTGNLEPERRQQKQLQSADPVLRVHDPVQRKALDRRCLELEISARPYRNRVGDFN